MIETVHAFSGFSVDDLAAAKKFYADRLGPDIAWFRDPAGNVISVLAE